MDTKTSKPDTRSRILNAALGLLAQHGAQALTQPRVCKAAGVRQSHLTYYFPTITDLLEGVATHTLEKLTAEINARGTTPRPAGSFVDIVVAASADKMRVRTMLGLITAADREAKLKPRMREFIAKLREGIAPAIQAGGLEGTPQQIAFMHSVVVGQAVLQLARDNDAARQEARQVVETAVRLLRGAE